MLPPRAHRRPFACSVRPKPPSSAVARAPPKNDKARAAAVPGTAAGALVGGTAEIEGVGEVQRLALGVMLPLDELGGWVQPLASELGTVSGGQGAHHVAPSMGA